MLLARGAGQQHRNHSSGVVPGFGALIYRGISSFVAHANTLSDSIYRSVTYRFLNSEQNGAYVLPAIVAGVGLYFGGPSLYATLQDSSLSWSIAWAQAWASQDDSPGSLHKPNQKNLHQFTYSLSGLVNVGNSCFMNSVLQALSSCPSYVRYLDNRYGGEGQEPCKRSNAFHAAACLYCKDLISLMCAMNVHECCVFCAVHSLPLFPSSELTLPQTPHRTPQSRNVGQPQRPALHEPVAARAVQPSIPALHTVAPCRGGIIILTLTLTRCSTISSSSISISISISSELPIRLVAQTCQSVQSTSAEQRGDLCGAGTTGCA